MKILQVYPFFFPAWGYGGVTRVCYNLSTALARKEHSVVVYTTDALDKKNRYIPESNPLFHKEIEINYFKNLSNYMTSQYYVSLPIFMPFLIKNKIKNFDIIHIHGHRHFLSCVVYIFARKYKIPYVIQSHGDLPYTFQETCEDSSLFKQLLKKIIDFLWGNKILKNAASCIALTKTECDQYVKMGVPEKKIVIIPLGMDLSHYEDLPPKGKFRSKYHISDNTRIVLSIGRIHIIKGIDLLVTAFSQVCCNVCDVKLVIAGPDDGFLPQIQQQVHELHLKNNVLFTGPLYGNDKLEAYIDADLFVLPSRYDCFPNTVLEAWACGTPVIMTKNCNISDIIRSADAGEIIEFDSLQLKTKIQYLLNNENERKILGQNGKKFEQMNLNYDLFVKKIEELYLKILG